MHSNHWLVDVKSIEVNNWIFGKGCRGLISLIYFSWSFPDVSFFNSEDVMTSEDDVRELRNEIWVATILVAILSTSYVRGYSTLGKRNGIPSDPVTGRVV